jgi:prolipoprotein diacylglyceryl transferase
MTISYLIWNGNPEIISFGSFALRWYGLLFALGFLISQQILYYMYRQEGKPEKDVDTLTIYMLVATVLGARFGHVLFYEPQMIWNDPLGIILPFEYKPEFKFTGLQGLASHGAAFGILFGLWLYSRKRKPGQNYLQVLDRIVILVALTGALIRLGNFFNSEIIGKPTDSPMGVVFTGRLTEVMIKKDTHSPLKSMEIRKDESLPRGDHGRVPVKLYLFFNPGISETEARDFLQRDVKYYLTQLEEYFDEPGIQPLHYTLTRDQDGNYEALVKTFGIARHAAQLYESISSLILFILLFVIWRKHKASLPEGRIFGWFLVILWSLRFFYEFLKKNQVSFEDSMTLNMGQILSIPLFIAGLFVLWYSYSRSGGEKDEAPSTAKTE